MRERDGDHFWHRCDQIRVAHDEGDIHEIARAKRDAALRHGALDHFLELALVVAFAGQRNMIGCGIVRERHAVVDLGMLGAQQTDKRVLE